MKSEKRIPFFLMWKSILRSNKWTLSLIIFFMSIAFINMIFITSLFNGIIDGFNEQIINTSTGNILITPKEGDEVIKNSSSILEKINDTEGVVSSSAHLLVPGNLQYKNKKGTWQILAVNPDDEKKVTVVSEKMIDGKYLDQDDTDSIILGRDITGQSDETEKASEKNNPFSLQGVSVGDTVSLNFGEKSIGFKIKGIFYTKFIDTDNRAFITKKAIEKINPLLKNQSTSIIVKTNKTGNEEKIITNLELNGVTENIYSWKEASNLMESISDSFLSINIILSIVGVLIAAITIFIVIYIEISNKRKQIGILRAIGIKPYLIQITYLLQTVVYSVSGVIFGSLIFFFVVIPYFNAHPFVLPICDATLVVNYGEFIARLETLIWVAIGAGLIPAIHITRIKILDAIWGR